MTIKELLEEYLSEPERLRFMANLVLQPDLDGVNWYLKNINLEVDEIDHRNIIDNSLLWSTTPEGSEYWRVINDRCHDNIGSDI